MPEYDYEYLDTTPQIGSVVLNEDTPRRRRRKRDFPFGFAVPQAPEAKKGTQRGKTRPVRRNSRST